MTLHFGCSLGSLGMINCLECSLGITHTLWWFYSAAKVENHSGRHIFLPVHVGTNKTDKALALTELTF